jgi:hypothetical protein
MSFFGPDDQWVKGEVLMRKLLRPDDMKKFCAVSSKHGAEYYKILSAYPEVNLLHLADNGQSRALISSVVSKVEFPTGRESAVDASSNSPFYLRKVYEL